MTELDPNLAKSGQYRVFVQAGGNSPVYQYSFVGCLSLGGFQQDLGTGDPIYCPSPTVRGKFDIAGTTSPPPSLPTTDFTQHMSRALNDFWWDLRKTGCEFNMQVIGSNCASPDNPDDFDGVLIARGNKLTAFNMGQFNGLDADAVLDLTGSLQLREFDPFRPITMGESADTATFSEALDGIYADAVQCGDCGEASDGCQKAYVLTSTIAASPALSSQIVHTKDGGSTWSTDDINTLATKAGNALAQVGNRIVVVSNTDLAHHHKLKSTIDAGTASGWTRVSSGYVAAHGPNAIWSHDTGNTYIAADGGYVYKMTNPTSAVTVIADGSATTQNLYDIRGNGNTIVAVGAANAVIVSNNNGATWSLVTGPHVATVLRTVEVITSLIWWVGDDSGNLYYTVDGGTNWTEATPDSTLTKINKIRFVNEVVGFFIAELSGSNRLYRTKSNGNTWSYERPYISGLPTAENYNFVAPCDYNTVLVGGLKTSPSTDGIIAIGAGA